MIAAVFGRFSYWIPVPHKILGETARTTLLVIRQGTPAPHFVTNEPSYASIVSAAKSSPQPTRLTTCNLLKINENQRNINNEQPSNTIAAAKDQVLTDTEPSIRDPMHTILEAPSKSSGDTSNRDGHTEPDDDSSIHDKTKNDSSDANSTSSLMPNVEEDSSLSSVHGRFWDSSSDNQEVELPTTAQWRPIKDPKRKRHLEYTLSHPNKMAVTSAWSSTLKQYGKVNPGYYTSDMADSFYDCFKVRNKQFSA